MAGAGWFGQSECAGNGTAIADVRGTWVNGRRDDGKKRGSTVRERRRDWR